MIHKQILVSGIQPSNKLTLGNYLGVIKNYLKLQNEYESFLFVADYHLITVNFDPLELKKTSIETVKYYLACGIDPNVCHIFYQSAVPEHLELCYLLLVHTSLGELNRMTQFKDKSQQIKLKNQTTTIPTGLLIYPILMAADILIYNANLVPVGHDQKQHLELARNIAIRMNNKYQPDLFVVPNEYIPKIAARVMDLQNPELKMSKSNLDLKGTIFLSDPIDLIFKKIMQAKTDSFGVIKYDQKKQPGIANLIQIYCGIKNIEILPYVDLMQNKSYKDLKIDVANVVCDLIAEIQQKYKTIDDLKIKKILAKNQKFCQSLAVQKIAQIHKLLGLNE